MDTKKKFLFSYLLILVFFICCSSIIFANITSRNYYTASAEDLILDEQEATVRAIKKAIPAVVSITVFDEEASVTLDVDTGEQKFSKEPAQKGRGTGFLISSDGYILTNKHVLDSGAEKTATYRVVLNSGKKYYAQLIGKDPINDLAVLKIFDKDLPYLELGNSSELELGTSVIAIGNALGQYNNSVTKGIVSGLGRNIQADDSAGNRENLSNIIQTDAGINPGNSGGPLIDLHGKVVGINVAIDEQGQSIGFAIAVNDARPVINSIRETGRIIRPRLGLRYLMLSPEIMIENNLKRESGAWVTGGDDENPVIIPDSAAAKAGIIENDIIFEINAIKIEGLDTLSSVINRYKPGNKIGLKIQRGDKIIIREVVLDEFK